MDSLMHRVGINQQDCVWELGDNAGYREVLRAPQAPESLKRALLDLFFFSSEVVELLFFDLIYVSFKTTVRIK